MTGSTWCEAAHRCVRVLIGTLACMLPVTPAVAQTQGVGLLKVADYPLAEKVSARADLSFDPTSSRLYVADSAQGAVHVFDTVARAFVGSVPGLPGVDRSRAGGTARGRGLRQATGDTTLTMIDMRAMSIIGTIDIGEDIGGLAHAPQLGELYVSSMRAPTVTVVDLHTGGVVTQVDLGAVGVNPIYDSTSTNVLLALPGSESTCDHQSRRGRDRLDRRRSGVLGTTSNGDR